MISRYLQAICRYIPSQCAVCHDWPAAAVCPACIALFAPPVDRCPRCAQATPAPPCRDCSLRPADMPWPAQVRACVSYQYPWRHLLHAFKFHGATGWALHFGQTMQNDSAIAALLTETDWLIPMPLADARMRARGFNQSQLLAEALRPEKTRLDLLLRSLDTVPQSALARDQRLANVAQAYHCPARAKPVLQGRRVTLLDDVMTSGASVSEATAALLKGGAGIVNAVVFARAE